MTIIVCIILILILLYMIKPASKRIDKLPVEMYAHRGLYDRDIPENSLRSFKAAVEKGYGVELDVQLTKDNKVVVFHDAKLDRMCNIDKKVCELTYEELQKYKLKGIDKIPLFSEVLDVLQEMPVICEIKSHGRFTDTTICRYVVNELSRYEGSVVIESFNPIILRWFKRFRPEFLRGQLSFDLIKNREGLNVINAFLLKNLLLNFISRPDFIAYRFNNDSLGFKLLRRIFKPLCVAWTVKGKEDIVEAKKRFSVFIFEK